MRLLKSTFLGALICMSTISCKKDKINCVATPAASSGNCIDSTLIDPNMMCTEQWDPVCGCDDLTYPNSCNATYSGVISYVEGECCDD